MLSATCHVGRLIELRLAGVPTIEDAAKFERDAHSAIAQSVRDTRGSVVICSDLRASHLFPPDVTQRLVHTMRGANANLERNAMLGNGSALLSLQMARLIREAAVDTRRRLFTTIEPLLAWLDELLSVGEKARLRQFLSEFDSSRLPNDRAAIGGAASRPMPSARRTTPRSSRSR